MTYGGIADVDDALVGVRADYAAKLLPGAADAVLFVGGEGFGRTVGVGGEDRGGVAKEPGLDLFGAEADDGSQARGVFLADTVELVAEFFGIVVVGVHDDDEDRVCASYGLVVSAAFGRQEIEERGRELGRLGVGVFGETAAAAVRPDGDVGIAAFGLTDPCGEPFYDYCSGFIFC